MNQFNVKKHQRRNTLHTLVSVCSMSLLLAFSVYLLFGWSFWLCLLVVSAVLVTTLRLLPTHWTLRIYNARRLSYQEAPELYRVAQILSQRAGLNRVPELYWIPSRMLNAFSVGDEARSGVGLTYGLLNTLTQRELAGVMAHEISHIAHNDTRLMTLADMISRLNYLLALAACVMTLLLTPMVLAGLVDLSLLALLLLVLIPWLSGMLQMKLSRTREFSADLQAVHLTGDPVGLASALAKIDMGGRKGWQRILPGYQQSQPSLLRSHPATEERIRVLRQLETPWASHVKVGAVYDHPRLSRVNI
ncbi:zinc metalloprotease HtpX [Oceanospirillum sediminis]|uniref:M48 family metalloprotease n=1 Tax=Oceanospirillum sediminis TaxID=2760088 RepID=A0A839ITR9_9GAMM|nr:zinc metalloprotease HtpX [Oceanospirillum sediminis]MBB1487879.1 M48 family metalloprotease [Oceanospirillum sediminis]